MESSFLCLEWELWAGEMTPWVKRLAPEPRLLEFSPWDTHDRKEQVPTSCHLTSMCAWYIHVCIHVIHTIKQIKKTRKPNNLELDIARPGGIVWPRIPAT